MDMRILSRKKFDSNAFAEAGKTANSDYPAREAAKRWPNLALAHFGMSGKPFSRMYLDLTCEAVWPIRDSSRFPALNGFVALYTAPPQIQTLVTEVGSRRAGCFFKVTLHKQPSRRGMDFATQCNEDKDVIYLFRATAERSPVTHRDASLLEWPRFSFPEPYSVHRHPRTAQSGLPLGARSILSLLLECRGRVEGFQFSFHSSVIPAFPHR